MTEEFRREERYIVIKRKHLQPRQLEALAAYIQSLRIRPIEAVVVESDWPEYETVWNMIENRFTGAASTVTTGKISTYGAIDQGYEPTGEAQ